MTRGRRYALTAALVAVVVVGFVALSQGGTGEPPPDRAADFVPADALLYLHLDADDEDEQERAGQVVEGVQGLRRLRDALLARASESAGDVDLDADVRPWLGAEAAAAIVGPSPDAARSLLVLEAGDEQGARGFMEELARPGETTTHRGTEILGDGELAAALVEGFVLVGPPEVVRQSLDVRAGAGPALADEPSYVELRDALPEQRLVHGYAPEPGLRALISSRAEALAEVPGVSDLAAGAIALSADDDRARVSFRGRPSPGTDAGPTCSRPDEEQSAAAQAPADSLVYAELADPACIARGLLASPDSTLAAALRRLDARLSDGGEEEDEEQEDIDLAGEILPLLAGRTSVQLTRRGAEAPVATLVARGVSGAEALPVLDRLQPALLRLADAAPVVPPDAGGGGSVPEPGEVGQAPGFEAHDIGGVTAFTAALGPGIQLSYAALDDSLAVSTNLDAIGEVANAPESALADAEDFGLLLEDRPSDSSAVVFLDLDKLLALGDEIGLAEIPAYLTARADLEAIDAAAAVFSREGDQTRAELLFKTP